MTKRDWKSCNEKLVRRDEFLIGFDFLSNSGFTIFGILLLIPLFSGFSLFPDFEAIFYPQKFSSKIWEISVKTP